MAKTRTATDIGRKRQGHTLCDFKIEGLTRDAERADTVARKAIADRHGIITALEAAQANERAMFAAIISLIKILEKAAKA